MAGLVDVAERPREPLQVPMTALLAERECGLWRPPALERLVKEARARNVRLSDCRDIDPPFPGSEVSCMAIDEVEDRYLLCGFADGSLAIVDVEERPGAKPLKFEAVVRIDRAQGPHARGHSFGISGLAWYPKDTGASASCLRQCCVQDSIGTRPTPGTRFRTRAASAMF